MLDDTLIRHLAAELHQSEQSRVQVEHFSKRYPGMTIEDGYRISRAWVALQLAEGRQAVLREAVRQRAAGEERHLAVVMLLDRLAHGPAQASAIV